MFSVLRKALFGDSKSTASSSETSSTTVSPHSSQSLVFPRRPLTKMECDLHRDLPTDLTIENPTQLDFDGASKLPTGSLRAIWAKVRGEEGRSVDLFFVGRDAHHHGPYVLLRARHESGYLFHQVQNSLRSMSGATVNDHTIGRDNLTTIVRFPREMGLSGFHSDRQQFKRAQHLLVLHPEGAQDVVVTRLVLQSVRLGAVAQINRLGDEPYTLSLLAGSPSIVVRRGELAAAA